MDSLDVYLISTYLSEQSKKKHCRATRQALHSISFYNFKDLTSKRAQTNLNNLGVNLK